MDALLTALLSSFFLGVASALHPCPLSTNVAVIALISSWSQEAAKRRVMLGLFVVSYVLSYVTLAIIISSSLFAVVDIAQFINRVMLRLLGPMLIIVGMFHCRLLHLHWSIFDKRWQSFQQRGASFASPIVMGFLLALAFCPATAALFFGVLIPLTVNSEQTILLPLLYGCGAALPLIIISLLLRRSMQRISGDKKPYTHYVEKFSLFIGVLIILIGIYVSLNDIFWS